MSFFGGGRAPGGASHLRVIRNAPGETVASVSTSVVAMGIVRMIGVSLFILLPAIAHAENRRVTMMRTGAQEAFWARLAAEMEIAGFSISDYPGDDAPGESDIETVLETSCAFVFIRPVTRTVALYYRTPDGQLPHLVMPVPKTGEEEQVTSIHLAEVLRVAFDNGTYLRTAVDRSPVSSVESAGSGRRDRFIGELAPELLFGDLSRSPQIGIRGALGVQLKPGMHGALRVHAPIRGISIREPEGEMRIMMAGFGAHVGMSTSLGGIRPGVCLGYQLWLLRATTTPAAGFEGQKSLEVTGGPVLSLGAMLMMNRRLGITLRGTVAFVVPAVSYGVTTRNVARIGRPLLGISLGISRFPERRRGK
jgi:hypothetical protein